MTDLTVFREYEPHELGADGYPLVWHDRPAEQVGGVKDLVRAEAGQRCVRCGHPYTQGCGGWGDSVEGESTRAVLVRSDPALAPYLAPAPGFAPDPQVPIAKRATLWSPCDEACIHGGPVRWRVGEEPWTDGPRCEGWRPGADSAYLAAPPGSEIQAAWRILTVHHLNGRKHDLRWWNLAALCQRCHLTIQGRVQMERVYPYEHTPWFRPFAAAWYAYSYLGETLTREETMARLDELLALERMA